MVAHSGFITVARKVDRQLFKDEPEAVQGESLENGLDDFKEENDTIIEPERS